MRAQTAKAVLLFTWLLPLTAGASVEVQGHSCDDINAAIHALPMAGGTVVVPAGEYVCENPVVMDRDNVSLIGAGSKTTLLKAKAHTPIPVLVLGRTHNVIAEVPSADFEKNVPYPDREVQNLVVSGFTIDGNMHSYPNSTAPDAHPNPGDVECWNTVTHKSSDCKDDLGISIRNNGVSFRRVSNVRVTDVVSKNNYSGGFVSEKHCKNIVMEKIEATDNWYDGIAGYLTQNSVTRDFKTYKNRAAGISIDGTYTKNLFVDGEVTDNGDVGVFSNEVNDNTYLRLKVAGNGNSAFSFDGIRDDAGNLVPHSCDDQKIIDTEINAGTHDGIALYFPCKGVKINNVRIIQATKACLNFAAGAEAEITGSTCSDGQADTKAEDLRP